MWRRGAWLNRKEIQGDGAGVGLEVSVAQKMKVLGARKASIAVWDRGSNGEGKSFPQRGRKGGGVLLKLQGCGQDRSSKA